jgi:stress response protein SCP2
MVQDIQQGGNVSLQALASGLTRATVQVAWAPERIGGLEVDSSAFLLGSDGKVRSDADFVFYNQPRSSDGSVQTQASRGGKQRFSVDLGKIAAAVERIAFVATIHGESGKHAGFGQAQQAELTLEGDGGTVLARFKPSTSGMTEAALILGELYRRGGEWKLRAVGQGFNGGLGPLATSFGVDVGEEAPAATPAPAARSAASGSSSSPPAASSAGKVRLEKRLVDLEKKDPQLVSLVKKVQVSLDKKDLATDRAKVALCLDISLSMARLYRQGHIDHLVQRIMALGFRFDDDGEIDLFAFAGRAYAFGTVGVDSYRGAVAALLARYPLQEGTRYGRAMALIREHYRQQPDFGRLPVYVMLVTDGNTGDKPGAERQLIEASSDGIFWQFMAIGEGRRGRSGFEFLEHLDNLEGRVVDNANFFVVSDPRAPSDEELFDLLMAEYPDWLRKALAAGVLRL